MSENRASPSTCRKWNTANLMANYYPTPQLHSILLLNVFSNILEGNDMQYEPHGLIYLLHA